MIYLKKTIFYLQLSLCNPSGLLILIRCLFEWAVQTGCPWHPPDKHFLSQQGTAAWGRRPTERDWRVGQHTAEQQSPTETKWWQPTWRPRARFSCVSAASWWYPQTESSGSPNREWGPPDKKQRRQVRTKSKAFTSSQRAAAESPSTALRREQSANPNSCTGMLRLHHWSSSILFFFSFSILCFGTLWALRICNMQSSQDI